MTNDNTKSCCCGAETVLLRDGNYFCLKCHYHCDPKPLHSEPKCEHDFGWAWYKKGDERKVAKQFSDEDCIYCKPVEPHTYEVEFKTKDLPKLKPHIHIEPLDDNEPVEPSVEGKINQAQRWFNYLQIPRKASLIDFALFEKICNEMNERNERNRHG